MRVLLGSKDPSARCTHSIVTCVSPFGQFLRTSVTVCPEQVTGCARSMVSSVSSLVQLPGPLHSCGEPATTSRSSWSTFTPWDTYWTKDPLVEERFARGQCETGSNRHSCRAFGPQSRHDHGRQRARLFKVRRLATPLMHKASTGCTITSASASTLASCSTWTVNLLMRATSPAISWCFFSDFDVEGRASGSWKHKARDTSVLGMPDSHRPDPQMQARPWRVPCTPSRGPQMQARL